MNFTNELAFIDNVSVLTVTDKDSEQTATAIVRSVNGCVALTLSLEHEADVQVVFTPAECAQLVNRLQTAIAEAQAPALVS